MAKSDSNLDCSEFRLLATTLYWVAGWVESMRLAVKWALHEPQCMSAQLVLPRVGHSISLHDCSRFMSFITCFTRCNYLCMHFVLLFFLSISPTCNIRYFSWVPWSLWWSPEPGTVTQGTCSINICDMNQRIGAPMLLPCACKRGILHEFPPSQATLYFLPWRAYGSGSEAEIPTNT